jgi:hypothetical protein
MLITPELPDNLDSLHKEEERIRTLSKLAINGNAPLKDHIKLIHECLAMISCIAKECPPSNVEAEQVVYGLGIRLFNSASCFLKLCLSGYYQGATSFIRDLVEVGFLLDYFAHEPKSISIWKTSRDIKECRQFKPGNIRKTLDERDGHLDKKRGAMYSLLSRYGTHATFEGFQLTSQNQTFIMGPFDSEKFLKALIEETCKTLPYVVLIYLKHFKNQPMGVLEQKLHFLQFVNSWWKQYMNSNFEGPNLDEIKAMISYLEQR